MIFCHFYIAFLAFKAPAGQGDYGYDLPLGPAFLEDFLRNPTPNHQKHCFWYLKTRFLEVKRVKTFVFHGVLQVRRAFRLLFSVTPRTSSFKKASFWKKWRPGVTKVPCFLEAQEST